MQEIPPVRRKKPSGAGIRQADEVSVDGGQKLSTMPWKGPAFINLELRRKIFIFSVLHKNSKHLFRLHVCPDGRFIDNCEPCEERSELVR